MDRLVVGSFHVFEEQLVRLIRGDLSLRPGLLDGLLMHPPLLLNFFSGLALHESGLNLTFTGRGFGEGIRQHLDLFLVLLFAGLLFMLVFAMRHQLALKSFPVILKQLVLVILLQLRAFGKLLKNVIEDALFDLLVLQHVLYGNFVLVLRSYIFCQDSEHIRSRFFFSARFESSLVKASFVFIAVCRVYKNAVLESVWWPRLLKPIRRLYRLLLERKRRVIVQIGHVEIVASRCPVIVHQRNIKLGTPELKVRVLHSALVSIVMFATGRDLGVDGSKTFCSSFCQFGNRPLFRFISHSQIVVHSSPWLFELRQALLTFILNRFLLRIEISANWSLLLLKSSVHSAHTNGKERHLLDAYVVHKIFG